MEHFIRKYGTNSVLCYTELLILRGLSEEQD